MHDVVGDISRPLGPEYLNHPIAHRTLLVVDDPTLHCPFEILRRGGRGPAATGPQTPRSPTETTRYEWHWLLCDDDGCTLASIGGYPSVIYDPARPLPEGWRADTRRGFGPFTTELTLVDGGGVRAVWDSRRHRKRSAEGDRSTWWAPRELGWWMGVLFSVGSACFAVAAVPAVAAHVGDTTDNAIYFVGSIFFTIAGLLQYAQVVGVDDPSLPSSGARLRRLATWSPHRIDWLAAAVQSVGTIFFNISTGHALTTSATSATDLNHAIWRPDALGSICFLVSSYLSFAEVCHGSGRWLPRDLSWWITVGNLAGSAAFGVSAVAAKFVASGEIRSVSWTTIGTFVGGLFFFAASILLLSERTKGSDAAESVATGLLSAVAEPS